MFVYTRARGGAELGRGSVFGELAALDSPTAYGRRHSAIRCRAAENGATAALINLMSEHIEVARGIIRLPDPPLPAGRYSHPHIAPSRLGKGVASVTHHIYDQKQLPL